MERRWSNELGALWIPWDEEPARKRLSASRSVDFALASRPAAVMLVAAVLAQSAAAPVSALAQGGKDPVGWLPPNEGGSTSGEDNVADGQAGDEDQPDTSVDPAPAPPAPTPEPVAPPPAVVATPEPTPEAVATPEAAATPEVPEAPPAPVPAETPPPAPAETPPPAPAETSPAATAPVASPVATATPELRVQSDSGKRRDEPERSARRTAAPAPPPPPAPSRRTAAPAPPPPPAPAPVRSAPVAVTTAPAAPVGAHYVVQPGDSLWRIAERLLGPRASVKAVAALTAALWERNQDRIGSRSPDVLPGRNHHFHPAKGPRMTRLTKALVVALAGLFAIPVAAHAGVLTSGTLTNAEGVPSAGTVKVYAFGLPSGQQKTFDSPLLGQAAAGADGAYTVSTLDDGQLLRLARGRDGYLDLVAIGDIAGARAVWNYTVKVSGTRARSPSSRRGRPRRSASSTTCRSRSSRCMPSSRRPRPRTRRRSVAATARSRRASRCRSASWSSSASSTTPTTTAPSPSSATPAKGTPRRRSR